MWRVSASPPVPDGTLEAVAAVSAGDVWAVGRRGSSPEQTLVERWNGKEWRVLASRGGVLMDVAAVSSSDVWAVGTTTRLATASRPLIEHWDGRKWTIMTGARAPATQLYGVAAVSSSDVWAVGGTDRGDGWTTFIEHWDGHLWKRVAGPPGQEPLDALAPFSSSDIWAVGWSVGEHGDHEGIQHWDGTSWQTALTRHFGKPNEYWYPGLSGVDGTSSHDLWVVGDAAAGPLVEHWDGVAWREVPIPFAHFAPRYDAKVDSSLNGVVALSATDVWAVGFGIEHWNGRRSASAT
jgi:hypothetical protein